MWQTDRQTDKLFNLESSFPQLFLSYYHLKLLAFHLALFYFSDRVWIVAYSNQKLLDASHLFTLDSQVQGLLGTFVPALSCF